MGGDTLDKVNWSLPGMENFTPERVRNLTKAIEDELIVHSIHCLGWALWPTKNEGYYDTAWLRCIADFLEIQNKPWLDEYDEYCEQMGVPEEDVSFYLEEFS